MSLDDQQWYRIGYVVREIVDAMASNVISEVSFGWVKYRIDFKRSGPGFYAAIDITRKGCRAASPR